MPESPQQLIKRLVKTIEGAADKFNESLPAIQKDVFAKVVELAKDLDTQAGRITPSANNVRLIGRIQKELERIILNKPYLKRLDEFVKAFGTVQAINTQYFGIINSRYKPGQVFKAIKKQIIGDTIESLTASGIGRNVTGGIREILRTNITSGGKMSDFIDQIRNYITDTKSGDGAMVKYASQIATDSINQYNAHYTQAATADLGLEWFLYAGSLKRTSREFCKVLIEAGEGCMEYIHKSQFSQLVKGEICGDQIAIYKKTGLPYGFIEGTTADNLFINRGGYNCGHQFYPVSSVLVPDALRKKFEKN